MTPSHEWLEQAACKGTPITLWYWHQNIKDPPARAVELCNSCPVKTECLNAALALPRHHDEDGYRAGTTPADRRRLRRNRHRNRAA